MKKLLFLVNPLSGSGAGIPLAGRVEAEMQSRLPAQDYDIVFTEKDVSTQAAQLGSRYETLVVAGGDGTLSHVARTLIKLNVPPSLGAIPLGTGNDLARSLGLLHVLNQKGLSGLIDLFLAGSASPVDIFTLGDQHTFINYAGFGRDAAIAGTFDRMRKKQPYRALCSCGLSKLLYALLAIACSRQKCASGLQLSYQKPDGSTETMRLSQSLSQLLITNIDSYGAGTRVSSKSRMDDGQLEITIMRSSSRWLLLHLSRFMGRAYDQLTPPGSVIRTGEASLRLPGETPAQIDGETIDLESGAELNIKAAGQLMMIADPQP